jgi:hypothetical protein
LQTLIILTEAQQKNHYKNATGLFNTKFYPVKEFDQRLSNDVRATMGAIPRLIEGTTDVGWATTIAVEKLAKQPEKDKFLFISTDGYPNPSPAHNRPEFILKNVLKKTIEEHPDIIPFGILIGKGAQVQRDLWPYYISVDDISELKEKFPEILHDALADPQQFKRKYRNRRQ